jgi:hypothetical protein
VRTGEACGIGGGLGLKTSSLGLRDALGLRAQLQGHSLDAGRLRRHNREAPDGLRFSGYDGEKGESVTPDGSRVHSLITQRP